MNYEEIKAEAKEMNKRVTEFLALSPNNDPFYVGSPGQLEKAKWFAKVYEKMGKPGECHIRRVHYWNLGNVPKPDGSPYKNTVRDWDFMTMAAKYARYADLVPIENIIDRRNPPPSIHANHWENDNPTDIKEEVDAARITRDIINKFDCYNPHNTQNFLIELWCEKSTMNDILEPICRKHGFNLVTGLGELSITAVNNLIDRIEESGKPTRIFYISDFDPAGECMPVSVARKIEYILQERGMDSDVKLKSIMLTASQCKEYKLPRTPIKPTERRKEGFEDRHGSGATELDALEALKPGEMKKVIEKATALYFDTEAWNKAISLNMKIQRKVREHLVGKIDNVLEDLDLEEFDDQEIEKEELYYDNDEEWLFDSDLDYFDQIENYKAHKN